MNKKILSMIISIATVFSSINVSVANAESEKISFPTSYNFENGFDGWALDTSKDGTTLERLTENGNSFLRLTATSGQVYRAADKIDVIPNGYIEPENPFEMAADSEVVISLDVRTSNSKFMKNFMINRDKLNDTVKTEVQYNFTNVWSWKKDNSIAAYADVGTQSVGGYTKVKSTTLFGDEELENDKWYNFKTILYTDDAGLPEVIRISVSDGNDVNLLSDEMEIKNETLRLSNKITRLDFSMGNAGFTLTEDETFDIDNVKIYTQTDERYWELKSENEGNIFGDVDEFKILFSGEMQKSSLNSETIKLYDSKNNEITYSGEYDEKNWEYSITPSQKLANGTYSIWVDTEKVNGLRSDNTVINGMSTDCPNEGTFTVFSGNLPEVKDFNVTGKNIPGGELIASGEFYQESGIEGYLKYQWWYSETQNGEYEEIDDETNNKFIPRNGFYDKFIKVSVIPVSNDGNIRGKEIFSDAISPAKKPEVKGLTVSGKNTKNEAITAKAEYYQEDGLLGHLEYQWWYSESQNGKFNEIDGEVSDTFIPRDGFFDKFIKVSVTPVSDDLGAGEKVFSNPISPAAKPYAMNVKLSGVAIEGMQAMISYDFADDNGDDEGLSIYEWFISDTNSTSADNWTKIPGETSKSYSIKKEDTGKYIRGRITPVSKEEPTNGSPVWTDILGPIKSLDSINLITNSGFEDGQSTGWDVYKMGGDNATVEATKEDAYSGEWSGRFKGQTNNSTFMVYGVRLEGKVRYIETCMMKVAPDSTVDNVNIVFYGQGNPKVSYEYSEQAVINKKEWTRVSQIISLEEGGLFSEMPQFWAGGTGGYTSFIDDFYIAPLLIADIKAEVPDSVTIPVSGETASDLAIYAILNQIDTTLGLEEETAYWEIDENVKGVYVKDDKLYVTSDAVSGTLNLKVSCEPQFDGASQTKFTKSFPITLVTNSNKTPRINSINLLGDTSQKSQLELQYDFYQVDGCADMSEIKWFAKKNEKDEFLEVPGSGKTFDVTEEYLGYYIKAEVTPIDGEGRKGSTVTSNVAGAKMAPIAENVTISGKGFIGDVIKSQYTYYDFNGDEEGATKFQWMRATSENGEYREIEGAKNPEYTVTANDVDCFIKLQITPVSKKQPFEGKTVLSNAIKGPRAPRAEEVSISVSGKVLTGKYKYVNDNGIGEGDTVCQWLVEGHVVETGVRYEADFKGTKTVEFRVTPIALQRPCEGESVSATVSVTVGGSGGGGGGGSSMSGGLQSSWANSTIIPQIKPKEDETKGIKDIEGHWSKTYAEKVVEKGIMTVDANGLFYPDKMVTRSEMITYIFKAMGYSETDYRNEFGDVTSGDSYAKKLQTMVDKGIISKDINFRPNDNVTRQEVCKILSIALNLPNSEFDLAKYADISNIGDWAIPYVKNIINTNLMVGVSANLFSPRTNITNGQIAKIVSMIQSGNYNKPAVGTQTGNQTAGGKIDLSSNDLKVLFIGGSLTQQGKEWQDMTIEALKAKLPGKNISYENMGLGGTASSYGAMRYQHDVLEKNPDIVFIEFAVNDASMPDGNGHSMYMEEMVRQSLRSEKIPAIVFLYAPYPENIVSGDFEPWQTGVNYKEKLAEHYGIKSVNIAEYMLWDIENRGVSAADYINEHYKATAASWDVHGGYIKYGEAIAKAIGEDYESFLRTPKNVAIYHEENSKVVNYSVIPAYSDEITYTGEWKKCVQGEFEAFDEHSVIADHHFNYFGGALMQTLKKDTEFEFTSNAEAVKLQFVSSKAGNSAKVYVDGIEKGIAETFSVNAGMNYDSEWVELPNDGKDHVVKFVIDTSSTDNYVFTFGSIMERRK